MLRKMFFCQSVTQMAGKENTESPNIRSRSYAVESTLSKTDTLGAGTKCPSSRDVRLIKSKIKGVKKGRDQL